MQNPYTLPDGNVAIAFSGGRTSAFMLHQILEANGPLPDRVVVSFQNTGREMPETLDFVQECSDRWGVPVVWLEYRLRWTGAPHDVANKIFDSAAHSYEVVNHNNASRNGEPFEQVLEYFGYIPPSVSRACSRSLKNYCAMKYCRDELGWHEWVNCLGIRKDEPSRATREGVKKDRMRPWYPLFHAGVTKEDVAHFWSKQSFDLKLPNNRGKTLLGNCDGCFLKSEANRAQLIRDYPERAAWWERLEEKYGSSFHKNTSWKSLRQFVERQGAFVFDTEGALCQRSDGECTG